MEQSIPGAWGLGTEGQERSGPVGALEGLVWLRGTRKSPLGCKWILDTFLPVSEAPSLLSKLRSVCLPGGGQDTGHSHCWGYLEVQPQIGEWG